MKQKKWVYSAHIENDTSYNYLTSILKSGFIPIIKNHNVTFTGNGKIVFSTKQEKLDFILFNSGLRNID